MPVTVKAAEIKATFNGEKTGNPFFDYFFRPLSFYCTVPLVNMGVSPNQASLIGLFIGINGLVLWCLGNWAGWIIGTVFMLVYLMFDFIDGNIARYNDNASYIGKFLDAFFNKVIGIGMPFAIAIGLINFDYDVETSILGLLPWQWMLLVGLSTTLWMLERESYTRYESFLKTIEEYRKANDTIIFNSTSPNNTKLKDQEVSFTVRIVLWALRKLRVLRGIFLHGIVFIMIPLGLAECFLIIFVAVSIVSSLLEIMSLLYRGSTELNVYRRSATHRN